MHNVDLIRAQAKLILQEMLRDQIGNPDSANVSFRVIGGDELGEKITLGHLRALAGKRNSVVGAGGTYEYYLTAREVRIRYGNLTDGALRKRAKSSKSNFPKPIHLDGRRLYNIRELEEWDKSNLKERG